MTSTLFKIIRITLVLAGIGLAGVIGIGFFRNRKSKADI